MGRRAKAAIVAVVMIAVIVGIDAAFLRGSQDTTLRLIVNIGLVVVFLGIFWAVFRRR